VSTRLIGALIMAHSDDDGLVLPPRLAPIQAVVIPIYRNDAERATVLEAVHKITAEWKGRIRFHIDDRDHLTPGFKFNEWELRGVPLRIEVGPKDVEKKSVAVARRVPPSAQASSDGKKQKQFLPQAGLLQEIESLLAEIQRSLFDRALRFRDEHTYEARNYDELKQAVEKGFVRAYWAGSRQDEEKIQEETKATIRVIPLQQPDDRGKCVYTGKEAKQIAVFARAY
jgi:prolyl-tRNA synthetase